VKLSITHKRHGPELCADLDVGQADLRQCEKPSY